MRKTKLFSLMAAAMLTATTAWADVNADDYKLPGAFSVSPTKVVYFSQGNLQYNSDEQKWQFAANQWEYIGNTTGNTSITVDGKANNTGVADLFGWVGASSIWDTELKSHGLTSSNATNNTNGYGNVANENLKDDWGSLMGTGWRTLTSAEWTYILDTRSGNRYAKANVHGVNGLILLPDGWTQAASGMTGTLSGINSSSGSFSTVSDANWTILEDEGCVFLPAAGGRYGTSVSYAGSSGYYWSSSPRTSNVILAYYMLFYSSSVNPADYSVRTDGYSVRLVSETAPPTPATVTAAPTAISGLIYNGSAQDLINAGIASGGTINYSLDNSTWSTSIPTATDADDYTVYYKVVGDASHTDYTPSPNTVAVTISKADAVITDVPAAVEGLVYTGSAQTLISAGSATGGELQYKVDASAWSTDLPTGTDASDYTVYYKVVGDGNHNGIDESSFNVTIAAPAAVIGDPNNADQITAFLNYYDGQNVAALTIKRPVLNNMYNTLCLPFDMDEDQIAASSLNGFEIYELEDVSVVNDELYLYTGAQKNAIVAGRPYLVKFSDASQLNELNFANVVVNNANLTEEAVTIKGVTFTGTFQPVVLGAQTELNFNGGHLFLGQNNQLFWPNTNNPLKPFRAYFTVNVDAGQAAGMPMRRGMPAHIGQPAQMPTGVESIQPSAVSSQKVMIDGVLYIIRGEHMYDAQGQIVK